MKKTYTTLALLLFIVVATNAQVQTARYNTSMTPNSNGFYEYLPQGYNPTGTQTYPLLIFCHGVGELGDGSTSQLPKVLSHSTPRQTEDGIFPTSFYVNGETFKYIVISPQFINTPSTNDVNDVINYCINKYKVNVKRIYLTGLSMGGGAIWRYASESVANAKRLAAIVPVCGNYTVQGNNANNVALANLPVWGTTNENDATVSPINTINSVNNINDAPVAISIMAKKTIFFGVNSHDAWTQTYNLNFKENGLNVYEWMLQFQSGEVAPGPLPITGLSFSVSKKDKNTAKLIWTTAAEYNNKGFEIEKSFDGNNFKTVGFENSKSQANAGASYTYADAISSNTKVFYRLKQINNDNTYLYSPVKIIDFSKTIAINVYPNPVVNKLYISANLNKADVIISDFSGRQIKQTQLWGTNSFIDVQPLPAGMYMIKVKNDGETYLLKFVK
jgi:Secretion system C-terminal sorting domain